MKSCITVLGLAVLFTLRAAAQEWPRYATSLDYTFTRFNSVTNVPAFNANGGSGQFVYNFNRWFGGAVDLGAVHNGNIHDFHLDNTLVN